MKTSFQTHAKAGLSTLLTIVSLICFYSAIAIENIRQTDKQNSSVAASAPVAPQPLDPNSRFENEEDREHLRRFFGMGPRGVSPEAFAKARASALALPPSPLLQGRKFQPAPATAGDSPSPWSSPIPDPPIVPPFPWQNAVCSARIDAFGFDPTNTHVVYAGGLGGLLKSENDGTNWTFKSDNWQSQSVTSIAVDPNEPDHVYVATGSIAFAELGYKYGVGLYRSFNAGSTWTHLAGPNNVFVGKDIRKVAVDPHSSGTTNSTTVYLVNNGFASSNGGLWRSTDSGGSWSLRPRPTPGTPSEIRDLVIDSATTPASTLYISADNGVFKSTDGGGTWSTLAWNGGGGQLEVVDSVPYLLASTGGINKLYYYGNGAWTEIRTICPEDKSSVCDQGEPINPLNFAVDPSNPNIILLGKNGFYRTVNANAGEGVTWENIRTQQDYLHIHFDQRKIAFSEATSGLVYVGNDGGIWKSAEHGALDTWVNLNHNLPGVLLYSAALSQDGSMIGGTQDNGAVFYDGQSAEVADGGWEIVEQDAGVVVEIILGGDAFQALINPTDSTFSYYILNDNHFHRYKKTAPPGARDSVIDPPGNCRPWAAWSLNPWSPTRLTVACQTPDGSPTPYPTLVFRTCNATMSPTPTWVPIGGAFASPGNRLSAVKEAPNNPSIIYAVEEIAFSNPPIREVWLTENAGDPCPSGTPSATPTWRKVTHNLPSNIGINAITIHPYHSAVAYLSCDAAIYKTNDRGVKWYKRGLEDLVNHDLAIDPHDTDHIFAATDAGVFASIDGGETWGIVDGIPRGMRISSVSFNTTNRKLAAATFGRGVYILDLDIPPINVLLPVDTFDTSVPITTVIIEPVVTTSIASSLNYRGFQGDFTFDSNVVTFQSPFVQTAELTSNWSVSANILNTGPGTTKTLRISANGSAALNGSGTLFNLKMLRVSGAPGDKSDLVWAAAPSNFLFIDNNFASYSPTQPNGLITITGPTPTPTPTPVDISGTVVYCSNPSLNPVPSVTLTLTGSASGSTLSNGTGNYLFSSLASGGSYDVTPSKDPRVPGSSGINASDLIAVQQHFLGITLIPPGCRLTAADVNGSNTINALDVIAIQRFYLGLTGTANVGKYKFTPASRSYPGVTSNQTDQNYDTLIFGDVAAPFVH